MVAQASVTEERALQAAAAARLDPEQWRRDMADPAIARRSTRRQRPPAFVVDQVMPEGLDRTTLERLIAEAGDKSKAAP